MTLRRAMEIGVSLLCLAGVMAYLNLPTATTVYEIGADPGYWCGKIISVPIRVTTAADPDFQLPSGTYATGYWAGDMTNNSPVRVVMGGESSLPFVGTKLMVTGTWNCGDGPGRMFLLEKSRTRIASDGVPTTPSEEPERR